MQKPWYTQKKYIIGGVIAAVVLLAIVFGRPAEANGFGSLEWRVSGVINNHNLSAAAAGGSVRSAVSGSVERTAPGRSWAWSRAHTDYIIGSGSFLPVASAASPLSPSVQARATATVRPKCSSAVAVVPIPLPHTAQARPGTPIRSCCVSASSRSRASLTSSLSRFRPFRFQGRSK